MKPEEGLVKKIIKPDQWNTYEIRAEGRITWINGKLMRGHSPGIG